jgi:hypothetical protein
MLEDIDRDDEELPGVADFGNNVGCRSVKAAPLDNELRFAGLAITLAFNDLAREDNVFEVKDAELVIFEFVCCVVGNDIAERANQLAEAGDRHLGHASVYEAGGRGSTGATAHKKSRCIAPAFSIQSRF